MRRLLPLLLAAALSLTGGCSRGDGGDPVYSGTIEAVEVDVVAEVAGRILERPVDEGYAVEPGTLIAKIDPEPYRLAVEETQASLREARARLALLEAGYRTEEIEEARRNLQEAEAQVDLARTQVARVENLVAQAVSTQEDLDIARRDLQVATARAQAARARLDLVERGYRLEDKKQAEAEVGRLEALLASRQFDLDRTQVVSRVAGTVTQKLQEPGEYAGVGSPIVTVADLANLYTWVYLGEAELGRIRLGDDVAVRIDSYPGRDFPGRVVYISDEAEFTPKNVQTVEDRVQLVFGVKVAVANPDGALKVGVPADVLLRNHSAAGG